MNLYVDQINGSDSNTGIESSPVKSWAKVLDMVKTGDYIGGKIKVARGSVFNPSLYPLPIDVPVTVGHNPATFPQGGMAAVVNSAEAYWRGVTIEPYGEGMPPVFDLRLKLTNANFSPVEGHPNVYTISFPRAQHNNNNSVYGGVWEGNNDFFNQAFLNKPGAPTNNFTTIEQVLHYLEDTEESWYFDYTTSTTVNTYYVHLNSNPVTNGKEYRVRYFDWFVVATEGNVTHNSRAGITIKDVVTIGNANHNGAIWGANIDLDGVDVLEFARHGVMVHGSVKNTRVMFGSSEGGGCFHAFSEYTGQRRGTVYENCTAIGWKNPRRKTVNIAGYFYHAASGSTVKELRYVNCKAINCGTAYEMQSGLQKLKVFGGEVKGCNRLIYNINPIGSVRCDVLFSGVKAHLPAGSSFGEIRETKMDVINSNIYQNGSLSLTVRDSENAELNITGSNIVFDGSSVEARVRLINNTGTKIRILQSVIDDVSGQSLNLINKTSGQDADIVIDETVIGNGVGRIGGISDLPTLRSVYKITSKVHIESPAWKGSPVLGEFVSENANAKAYGKGDLASNVNGYLLYHDLNVNVEEGYNFLFFPGKVSSVTCTADGQNKIDVSWTADPRSQTYTLQTSGNGVTFTNIYSGNALSFEHTGLMAGQTCYYRVIGTNPQGNGVGSDLVSTTTEADEGGEDPDFISWAESLSLTTGERAAYDNFIRGCKQDVSLDGINSNWYHLDAVMLYYALSEASALKDIKRKVTAIKNGTVQFTAKSGIHGDGLNDNVNIQYEHVSQGVAFKSNDLSFGGYVISSATGALGGIRDTSPTTIEIGIRDDRTNNRLIANALSGAIVVTNKSFQVNELYTVKLKTEPGLGLVARLYEGSTSIGLTGAAASQLPDIQHYDLGRNGFGNTDYQGILGATFRGSSSVDLTKINDRIEAFITEISAL